MNTTEGTAYQEEFESFLDLAVRTHNAARSSPGLGPGTPEGHLVNENTLIRIFEELNFIRRKLGHNWFKGHSDRPGFDAFITAYVYRNSIVHSRGLLNDDFYCGDLAVFKTNYEGFCASVGLQPLQPGDELVLSVTQPDVLLNLIEGVGTFAQSVLGGQATPEAAPARRDSRPPSSPDTQIGTGAFGPVLRRK